MPKYKVGDKVLIEENGIQFETKVLEVYEGIIYTVLPYKVNGEKKEHEILGKVKDQS